MMTSNYLENIVTVATSSSTAEDRKNAIYNLIKHYGHNYNLLDKDAQKYQKDGNYGNFAEFLLKNVYMVCHHLSELYIWTGMEFKKANEFLYSAGREKKNADFLFKVDGHYEVCSCKMRKANQNVSISVSDVEINEELTKVIDIIKKDNSNPIIHGIIATYNKIGELDELSRRSRNAGYESVTIIVMNPEIARDKVYLKTIGRYNNLSFISFDDLWNTFCDIISNSFHNNLDTLLEHMSGTHTSFIPRIKQAEIANQMIDYLKSHDVCGLSAICRFGKTATTAYVIKELLDSEYKGKLVVFISFFPANFMYQVDDFRMVFGASKVNVSEQNGKHFIPDDNKLNIVMISVQYSYSNELKALAQEYMSKADFLIYDEAHIGFGSDKQQEFVSYFPKRGKTILVSATPYTSHLLNVHFFTFTDYNKFHCDSHGNMDYYANPNVLRIGITGAMDRKTRKKYTWESCDELIHSSSDMALYTVLLSIIEKEYNGIPMTEYLHGLRTRTNNFQLYREEPLARYLKNNIVWCNSCKDIPVIISVLTKLREEWSGKCDIRIKYSVSNPYVEELYDYQEYFERDALSGINSMFNDDSPERIINFFINVDMNTTGCTIRNADAVIHLHDGLSYNLYEQREGRIKERTFVKYIKGKEKQYSHFTFSFDVLPNRMLSMAETMLSYDSNGNIARDDELKYISSLYGYMDFCGILTHPTIENFICDITNASLKNITESLSNMEYIYRSFMPTGNNDISKFMIENVISPRNNAISNNGEAILFTMNERISESTSEHKEHDRYKKFLKHIAFVYSELLKKIIILMDRNILEKVDSGTMSFLDAIRYTLEHTHINRICYD